MNANNCNEQVGKMINLETANIHRLIALHELWAMVDVRKENGSFSDMLTRCTEGDNHCMVVYNWRDGKRRTSMGSVLPDMYDDEETKYLKAVIRAANNRLRQIINFNE